MTEQPADGGLAAFTVPPDYYSRLDGIEAGHWWHRGMRTITLALLGGERADILLDAGCGTGGFLRFALDTGLAARACGVDISREAVELATARVPEARVLVGSLAALPFETASVDLAVANDVLQHIPERELERSLDELRRVLRTGGRLLVRTNGARRGQRMGENFRVFDRGSLAAAINTAGFRCVRLTHANVVGSLLALARGRAPRAPTATRHGIPEEAGAVANRVGEALLRAEARYVAESGRSLPYGNTLFALALAT